MSDETDLAEIKALVVAIHADMTSERAATEEALAAIQAELTQVHGLARDTDRIVKETRNRIDLLIDAFAEQRREYLAAHPRD